MLSSSLYSQASIKAQAFRPYEDQWHGRDWSPSAYEDRWTDAYNDDILPSLTESVAGLFARVRASFSRA